MTSQVRENGIEQLPTAAGMSLDRRFDAILSKLIVSNQGFGNAVGIQEELIPFFNRYDQPLPS